MRKECENCHLFCCVDVNFDTGEDIYACIVREPEDIEDTEKYASCIAR